MKKLSIRLKIYLILIFISIVVLASTGGVVRSLNKAKDDADILNALGRQRMLTQAMGKSVLGYAMSKNEFNVIKNQVAMLNRYITQMRGVYTKTVIGSAQKAGIEISMNPSTEEVPAIPFPATLTRLVNEQFASSGISIDIIAQYPINEDKGYKDEIDSKAGNFLKNNIDNIFFETVEEGENLFNYFYTADIAIV